jgi:hypothetical protein
MELIIDLAVRIIQIGLFTLLLWGGALCLRDLMRRPSPSTQASDIKQVAPAEPADFERVASLVLLALLCTTLAGVPVSG